MITEKIEKWQSCLIVTQFISLTTIQRPIRPGIALGLQPGLHGAFSLQTMEQSILTFAWSSLLQSGKYRPCSYVAYHPDSWEGE